MIGLPELFALLAAAGSATFGVLALLTEFRDDRGRVGRRARLVIAGIVLSAALGILATRASDLARQDQAARRQENVLAAVWAENSRVEPGMVTALVTFTFQLEHLPRPPRLFQRHWTLDMGMSPPGTGVRPDSGPTRWSTKLARDSSTAILTANLLEINHRSFPTVDGTSYEQRSVYSQFTGDLGEFARARSWNGARLEAVLTASGEGASDRPWEPARGEETGHLHRSFEERYALPESLTGAGDGGVSPWPAEAEISVFVGHRLVATGSGWPADVQEWDEDVRGLQVVKFPVMEIGPETFIQPAPTEAGPISALPAGLVALGALLVAAVAGVGLQLLRTSGT